MWAYASRTCESAYCQCTAESCFDAGWGSYRFCSRPTRCRTCSSPHVRSCPTRVCAGDRHMPAAGVFVAVMFATGRVSCWRAKDSWLLSGAAGRVEDVGRALAHVLLPCAPKRRRRADADYAPCRSQRIDHGIASVGPSSTSGLRYKLLYHFSFVCYSSRQRYPVSMRVCILFWLC